jgi:hypothetical protein
MAETATPEAIAGPTASHRPEPPATAPAVKLIFLDVDGVICCNGIGRLEEDKLSRIKTVVEKTEAKVVLSTDWRRDATLKGLITHALNDRGITVIGATRKGPPLKPVRPQEITGWLDAYVEKKNPVSQWVAVDDRELISELGGERLKGHFVNTSFASGLTDRAAERMIAVLNGDLEQGMGAFAPRKDAPNRSASRGRRSPSPGRQRGAASGPLGSLSPPASAPAVAGSAFRGGGFSAATAPGGSQSSVGRVRAAAPAGTRAHAGAPAAANASRGGASPARGGRALTPTGGRAQSPGQHARRAAFGNAKPGLVSPTCARAGISSDTQPSASSPAPAAA